MTPTRENQLLAQIAELEWINETGAERLRFVLERNAKLREALKWAEAYVPKRADCETRRMIESLLPNDQGVTQRGENQ